MVFYHKIMRMKSKSNKIFSGLLALVLALTMMIGVIPMSASAASYSYNPSAAASYAIKYAYNYNTNYTSYKGKGGDCANFVSQCLYNGGIAKTSSWKPDSYQSHRQFELWKEFYRLSESKNYCRKYF